MRTRFGRAAAVVALATGVLLAPALQGTASAGIVTTGGTYAGGTRTCGPTTGYACTAGGYGNTTARNSGWPWQQYGGTYASYTAEGPHNCTLYAAYRLSKNGLSNPGLLGNARDWATNAAARGFRVDQTPAVGAIAQWNSVGYGHVAYVEEVTATTFTVTADNYTDAGGYTDSARFPMSAAAGINFIHFKDVAGPAVGEGSFIGYAGHVYRIAGGAPLYVSSWANVGGAQPVTEVSSLSSFRQYPADGTLVAAAGDVFRFAGGAPTYVSTWAAIGGSKPSIVVDRAAIDNPDGPSPWNHVRRYPADGTFVGAAGFVYRFAGGAPIYVSAWANVGGARPVTDIDHAAIDNADGAGRWAHIRRYPSDGTFVAAAGRVYRFAGGAPLYVSAWNNVGGSHASTEIDNVAIANADGSGRWAHVRRYPANGTFVRVASGKVYRFAGGAAMHIRAWSDVSGPWPTTLVDGWAIANPDDGDASKHVRKFPTDGTVLNGGPSDRYWKITSNQRAETPATVGAVRVSDTAIDAIPIVK